MTQIAVCFSSTQAVVIVEIDHSVNARNAQLLCVLIAMMRAFMSMQTIDVFSFAIFDERKLFVRSEAPLALGGHSTIDLFTIYIHFILAQNR